MKKILLTPICVLSLCTLQAQITIDTVSTGAGYANQIWYSLENDEEGSAPMNNWDIAFDVSGFGSSIHINSVIGTTLWKYPSADTSGWATLDTTGISTWPKLYNSDTSWSVGAFDKGIVISNPFDLGWGIYNPVTHIVAGDSLFVIKLSNGSYKKLWIKSLSSGVYTFIYADINGSNLQNASLSKASYTGKNFGYYSLQTNSAVDREPLSANWDLVFTQYTAFIPSAYTVAGILHNKGITTAQVEPIANPNTFTNWSSQSYNTAINEIGYDWKTYNGIWTIDDSLVYFVKTNSGDIWKIIPIGFGGSSNGNYIFSKEKLSTAGINNIIGNAKAGLSIYPNPASGGYATVIYNFENFISSAVLNIYDLTGKKIYSDKLNTSTGLHTYNLNTSTFKSGIYFVIIEFEGSRIQQKLIIH